MASATTETTPAATSTPPKRDFRQEVTDRIITMLESGVAPWQKPWNPSEASVGMPFNPRTERSYRGGNAIHLMATGIRQGYDDPRWMTYKQAADRGWQVRRGEKGTQIEFWEVKAASRDESQPASGTGDQTERDRRNTRLIHRVYTVFNAKQIEGVPAYQPRQRTPFEIVQRRRAFWKIPGRRSSTTRLTALSTVGLPTAFTCHLRKRSKTLRDITVRRSTRWRTGVDILPALHAPL